MTTEQNSVQELARRRANEIYQNFLMGEIRGQLKSADFYSPRVWSVWRRALAGMLTQVVFAGTTDPAKFWGSNASERKIVGEILRRAEGNDEFKRMACASILELLIAEERVDLLPRADAGARPSERTVTMDEGELRRALANVNQLS